MKIKNLLPLLGILGVFAYPCRAAVTTDSVTVDFGKIYQLLSTASITLGYSGEPALAGAAKSSSYTYAAGTAIFKTDNTDPGVVETIVPNAETASGVISGTNCTIEVSNVTFNPAGVELTAAAQTQNVTVGAKLSFSGFCREGTYNGTLSLPYSITRGDSTADASTPVNIPLTIQIEEPLSITKDSEIKFGNVTINPIKAGTVVLSPEGTVTASDGISVAGGTYAAGSAVIKGVGGRTVNISLSGDSATLNGVNGGTIIVNNFKTSPSGSSFTLSGSGADAEQEFKIGGTMNVGVAQKKGTYTGSITVTVAY